jgi:hypothetical protein
MDELATNIKHNNLYFSGNNIQIVIAAAVSTIVNRALLLTSLEVYMPKSFGSLDFKKITTLQGSERPVEVMTWGNLFYPGTEFDISAVINSQLSFCPPTLKEVGFTTCNGMTSTFQTIGSITNNGVAVANSTQIDIGYVIKSKLSVNDFAGWKNEFFTNFLDDCIPFLTFSPLVKTIDKIQPEYLYFLNNLTPKPSKINLRVKVYFDNGTAETVTRTTLNSTLAYTVYRLRVDFVALKIADLETTLKSVISYEVWLNNELGFRISEIRRFDIDDTYYYNPRYVIFRNSLGGYDTVRMKGNTVQTLKLERQTGTRKLPLDYLPSTSEIFITSVSGKKTISLSTGIIEADEIEYLQELELTEEAYIQTKDGLIPINLLDEEYILGDDSEDVGGRRFSFELAKNEIGYSNLPTAPISPAREIDWIPVEQYCIYDPQSGLATGYQAAASLKMIYKDTGLAVPGVSPKPNVDGTEGYFAPVLSANCTANTSPYTNDAISRAISFYKNDCFAGFGEAPIVTVAAGTFGGRNKAEANQKAELYFASLNNQAYANQNGTCTLNPENYTITTPASGKFNWRFRSSDNLTVQIKGGAGRNSTDNTLIVFGNSWDIQGNSNSSSVVYPVNKSDIVLPVTETYIVTIYSYDVPVLAKIYQNGTLLATKNITIQDFHDGGGSYKWELPANYFSSQAKAFALFQFV